MDTSGGDVLIHFGVKGMRWGVRKDRDGVNRKRQTFGEKNAAYKEELKLRSPGAEKTRVIAKTGETISVEKEAPGPMIVAVARLTGRKPEKSVSSMVIRDSEGKKAGSFQVWREGDASVRGEWLSIASSHQGRGYSRAAINGLLIAARKDPTIDTVRLQVPRNAEAAKHIYSSLGFSKDHDIGVVAGYGMLEDWSADVRSKR